MSDETEIIVCAGPPKCLLQNDEAVARQMEGCHICERVLIKADGSETPFKAKVN